jgi:hypothetical protein
MAALCGLFMHHIEVKQQSSREYIQLHALLKAHAVPLVIGSDIGRK